MDINDQIQIDNILTNAFAVRSSDGEIMAVEAEQIESESATGWYQAAYFICTMRQSKLASEYRPLKQVQKLAEKAGVKIDKGTKEPDREVNVPLFCFGI